MIYWLLNPWDALPGEAGFDRGQQVADALATAGHDVVWWQSSFSHAEKKTRPEHRFTVPKKAPQYTVVVLPACAYPSNVSPRRLLSIFQYVAAFARTRGQWPKPDAILVSGPLFFSELLLVHMARFESIPIVYEFRDLWPETIIQSAEGPARLGRWALFGIFRVWRKQLLKNACGIIGLNETYLRIGIAEAGHRRDLLTCVAYPTTDSASVGSVPSKFSKPDDQIWVISSGTLGVSHDHNTMLSAAALLRDRVPCLRFLITGRGSSANDIQDRIHSARLSNVSYLGSLEKSEFNALLRLCDVGLALYRKFSPVVFPTKIVDYLFAGLAVITSSRGEAGEILGKAGAGMALVPENPEELAQRLERLCLNRSELLTMRQRSLDLAPRFAPQRQLQEIVGIMQKAARIGSLAQINPI
jgi:glycosyltransferase involved in cell wall biosynthesis